MEPPVSICFHGFSTSLRVLDRGRRCLAGSTKMGNAVGSQPWPPCFQRLTDRQIRVLVPIGSNSSPPTLSLLGSVGFRQTFIYSACVCIAEVHSPRNGERHARRKKRSKRKNYVNRKNPARLRRIHVCGAGCLSGCNVRAPRRTLPDRRFFRRSETLLI